jgi:Protein of unknown function (DUF3558)
MNVPMRSAIALLIIAAAVGACGGSSATSAPATQGQTQAPAQASAPGQTNAPAATVAAAAAAGAIDACALITEKEATAFLGSDPGPGAASGTADAPGCAYGASLTIGIEPTGGQALYATQKAAMQGSGKAEDLTGVGDAGYVFIVANTIADMEILKGSVLLSVRIQGDPSLQNVTVIRLTALGTTAVGRL